MTAAQVNVIGSVKEGSTCWVTATPKDRYGSPAVPSSGYYTINCLTSGATITGVTTLTSLSTSIEVTIAGTLNDIQDQNNANEVREVTFVFSYGVGGSQRITEKTNYTVLNLQYVP